MQLRVDADITTHYAEEWSIEVSISPSDDAASVEWSPPTTSEDPKAFSFRLGLSPLTTEEVRRIRAIFDTFGGFDDIMSAQWAYLHSQGRWGWEPGPWRDACDELGYRLAEARD